MEILKSGLSVTSFWGAIVSLLILGLVSLSELLHPVWLGVTWREIWFETSLYVPVALAVSLFLKKTRNLAFGIALGALYTLIFLAYGARLSAVALATGEFPGAYVFVIVSVGYALSHPWHRVLPVFLVGHLYFVFTMAAMNLPTHVHRSVQVSGILALFSALLIGHHSYVTKRKLVFQSLEAENANRLKDWILSLVGHDLRNTVGNNLSGLEYLEKYGEEMASADRRVFLQEMHRSEGRSFELLERLVLWGKARSGVLTVVRESVNIGHLLEKVMEDLVWHADLKGVSIRKSTPAGLVAHVDSNILHAVLRNLGMNAVKFTPPNTEVVLGAALAKGVLHFYVRDHGHGLEPSVVESLYSHQGLTSERGTSGEKGSGLGLTLVKELVECLQGHLHFEQAPGEGALVRICLPMNEASRMPEDFCADKALLSALAL